MKTWARSSSLKSREFLGQTPTHTDVFNVLGAMIKFQPMRSKLISMLYRRQQLLGSVMESHSSEWDALLFLLTRLISSVLTVRKGCIDSVAPLIPPTSSTFVPFIAMPKLRSKAGCNENHSFATKLISTEYHPVVFNCFEWKYSFTCISSPFDS